MKKLGGWYVIAMQVAFDIQDELADTLPSDAEDRARKLLEDYTAQAYRDGKLTTYQVQCILDLPARMDVDPFLLKYGIYDYTVEMLESDLKHLESISGDRCSGHKCPQLSSKNEAR